jgi:hypothetical protein
MLVPSLSLEPAMASITHIDCIRVSLWFLLVIVWFLLVIVYKLISYLRVSF